MKLELKKKSNSDYKLDFLKDIFKFIKKHLEQQKE